MTANAVFIEDVGRRLYQNGTLAKRKVPTRYGQGGIRTLDALAGIPVFETGGFNRSPTCPNTDKTTRR